MEKIYMENNQNNKKQSTFQQVFKSQLSKKLSAMMVLVSFFSFLLIGVTNVSYAAVTPIPPDEGLGDSFTTQAPTGTGIIGQNSGAGFPVFMYSTTEGIPIFCLERDIDYRGGVTMTKKEKITDQGLLYVMAHTFPHYKFKDANGEVFPDEVQTWITQVAIWQYLYETGAANNGTGSGNVADIESIKTVSSIYWQDSELTTCRVDGCVAGASSQATFYDTYIADIIANAKQSNVTTNGTISMSLANQEMSITEDEKYYQTSLVTITKSDPDNFVDGSLEVSIKSAPDGTILVDENGQEIKDYSNLEKFYVRIPVESVTEENKVVQLYATGTVRGYDGYYYRADGAQTVSTVFTNDVPTDTGLEVPINYTPEVPDTSMSIAQSVYFIGLVVLLCGVGIIYANTKPKKQQQ